MSVATRLKKEKDGWTHLESDVSPVDAVVSDIKIKGRSFLDACKRNGHIVVVGLQ